MIIHKCNPLSFSREATERSDLALPSTIYNFEIDLSDVDRGIYESLAVKVARHPSETEDYLVARVLAYCLELAEGLTFSRGLAEPDPLHPQWVPRPRSRCAT